MTQPDSDLNVTPSRPRHLEHLKIVYLLLAQQHLISEMSSGNRQPFIDSRAFDKVNSTYVTFPSQSDAMLASLQLFHDVPCRIMDLICSVVTHPDFDSKQLTPRNSVDVIDVVEEHRLKDRMVIVQKRSASGDGCAEQAGFPQFILDEVLDIIHAERMTSIKARFEETLDERAMYFDSMHIEEDNTLKAMTNVHRSWTILAQKALGRVLHIGRPTPNMNVLLCPVRKSIFGPWTSAVAVQLYHPITETTEISDDEEYKSYDYSTNVLDEYRGWFENLHRILVGFTNLKCLYIKSYHSLFTSWSNLTFGEMVRRNVRLEEVTVYAVGDKAFNLDPLLENAAVVKNLRTLNIRGAWISHEVEEDAMREPGFACLNNVTIKRFFNSLESDLRLLSILSSQTKSRLESLRIIDTHGGDETFEDAVTRGFTPSQCAAVFEPLRALHIDSEETADQWFKWIGPYCSSLESLNIIDRSFGRQSFYEDVARVFTPDQCAAIFDQLRSLFICSYAIADLWFKLIGPYCTSLESLSIIGGRDMRETFEEDIVRAFTPSQSVAIFGQLQSLHIDSKTSADQWFKWIGPYCSSLKSLSISESTRFRRPTFEEDVQRASSSPQGAIVLDRLCTLSINSKTAAELWLKWIGPSCPSIQSVTLVLSVSLNPDILHLIPISIESLDLILWTEAGIAIEKITGWTKFLLKVVSSMHFPKLKSFPLFISEDYLGQYGKALELAETFHTTQLPDFKEEMSAVCEGVGVEFCLRLGYLS